MKIVRLIALFASLSAFSIIGCGDDDHGEEIPPECEEIAETCHDSTSDLGVECHENAEEVWTAQECLDNEADCLAECTE
jgi:hypothetical protein